METVATRYIAEHWCNYLDSSSSFQDIRNLWREGKNGNSNQRRAALEDIKAWFAYKQETLQDNRNQKMLKRLRRELGV